MRDGRGMALPEVLVGTALAGLVASLAVGTAARPLARLRVESAMRLVATGLERGRTAAQRQGRACVLELTANGWEAPEGESLPGCRGAATALQEDTGAGAVELQHNFAGVVRFSSNGLVLDGGTVVVSAPGTDLRRCLVMGLPLGVVRLGRYASQGGGVGSGACRPDPAL